MEKNINNKRVVARVVIEAATPLSISSGTNNAAPTSKSEA